MKINFNIKYRPQIESGEYRLETNDGKKVRIICWESNRDYPIVGLVTNEDGYEVIGSWDEKGNLPAHINNHLMIITPDVELTNFEKKIKEVVSKYSEKEMGDEAAHQVGEELLNMISEDLLTKISETVIPSRNLILNVWSLGNLWKEYPEEREGLTQMQWIQAHWKDGDYYDKIIKNSHYRLLENSFFGSMPTQNDYVKIYRPMAGSEIETAVENAIQESKKDGKLVIGFNGWFYLITPESNKNIVIADYFRFTENEVNKLKQKI